ncbi:unnamed protein product [Heligmosomoides polygyrus]|uniref:APOV1 n=1 Tax=Heligmosomoides polygyrus TaxID=6339 RepID=A0A183FCB9_HELPZ|nr:unnamed protein product [Heligmosomoides polygyrus]
MALSDTYGNYQKEVEQACSDGQKAAIRFQKNLPKMIGEIRPRLRDAWKAIKENVFHNWQLSSSGVGVKGQVLHA